MRLRRHKATGPAIDTITRVQLSKYVVATGRGGNEDPLVLLDQKRGQYWKLNDTAGAILRPLLADASLSELLDTLVDRYDVPRDVLHLRVVELLTELHDCHLISLNK